MDQEYLPSYSSSATYQVIGWILIVVGGGLALTADSVVGLILAVFAGVLGVGLNIIGVILQIGRTLVIAQIAPERVHLDKPAAERDPAQYGKPPPPWADPKQRPADSVSDEAYTQFRYKAVNRAGSDEVGQLFAADEKDAANKLREMGLKPFELKHAR